MAGNVYVQGEYLDFTGLSDEEILVRIHEGSTDALDFLITKYQSFVKMKARSYFMMGGDREDIIQEGMIGLYKAIRDYQDGPSCFVSGVCGVVHHKADHHSHQDGDQAEAYSSEYIGVVGQARV